MRWAVVSRFGYYQWLGPAEMIETGVNSTVKPKQCYWCGATAFRRLSRRSMLEKTVLVLIGIYPWECVMCRRKVYFRDDGHDAGSLG